MFSSEDVEPIADGATLYTCKIQGELAFLADGSAYPLAGGTAGAITVSLLGAGADGGAEVPWE